MVATGTSLLQRAGVENISMGVLSPSLATPLIAHYQFARYLLFSRMIAPYRAEFVDSGAQLEGGRLVRSAHPTTAKSQPGGRGISIAPYDSHGGSL